LDAVRILWFEIERVSLEASKWEAIGRRSLRVAQAQCRSLEQWSLLGSLHATPKAEPTFGAKRDHQKITQEKCAKQGVRSALSYSILVAYAETEPTDARGVSWCSLDFGLASSV
jgi:hypothetical protein